MSGGKLSDTVGKPPDFKSLMAFTFLPKLELRTTISTQSDTKYTRFGLRS
jgi:hypothetical protein